MKKTIALLLALITLLSLGSCSSSLATEETVEKETLTAETAETKEAEKDSPITLPEGFSVGYARKDITPISWPAFLTENGG